MYVWEGWRSFVGGVGIIGREGKWKLGLEGEGKKPGGCLDGGVREFGECVF